MAGATSDTTIVIIHPFWVESLTFGKHWRWEILAHAVRHLYIVFSKKTVVLNGFYYILAIPANVSQTTGIFVGFVG